MRWMLGLLALACALGAPAATFAQRPPAWERTPDGVVVHPATGQAREVRLRVMNERIIRVTAVPAGDQPLPASVMVVAQPSGSFETALTNGVLTLTTPKLRAEILLSSGAVRFFDAQGHAVLSEVNSGAFSPVTVEGQRFFATRQEFSHDANEGVYGLGQHQNLQMDLNGEDVELAQHNMDIGIPFLVSTRNYGILWDNNSITRFGDARPYQNIAQSLTLRDAQGVEGALTAQYYRADQLALTRRESDIDYQFLPTDQFRTGHAVRNVWPQALGQTAPDRVVWTGSLEAHSAGVHKFRLYASSYFKLSIDDHVVIDGWRQNWNPWYRNFAIPMASGERHTLRLEWRPNDGYIKLDHLDALANDERHELSLASEVGRAIDYYFVAGDSIDDVIGGYRTLTGPALILPRWAYGFWQSRQRYNTQAELLGVLHEYRQRHIPLDNMVQDWFYWPENAWGSHDFDRARYPDPGQMVREVHANNAHIMISVWPKFYPGTANYRELDAINGVYRNNVEMGRLDWVGPGYRSTYYDPYSRQASDIYWRQIREKLGVLGFDAWWLDNDEPDIHSNLSIADRTHIMTPTAAGPGAEYFNSYPLVHVGGVYDRAHADNPDKRQFIFTRSAWGGIQRYSAAVWSGDVAARWYDLKAQVAAGVNMSLAGMPNWTFDIGGFAVEPRLADPAAMGEFRELYLRWFQFGAFVPIFRAHGEFPLREIYNISPPGTPVYASMLYYDRLRYRLLPYIYTLAGDTYHHGSTIMRGLVMDFPNDVRARTLNDEYLFGPAFLVSPVSELGARSRRVYLPGGVRWYDFYTGRAFDGGKEIEASAPLERMPLFVRAGSIVPIGPAVEYTSENSNGPLTLLVYTGADAAFDLYEDDGLSYGYQSGAFSTIPIRYNEASGTLSIGARRGSYPGMGNHRVIRVRWISGPSPKAGDLDAPAQRTINYSGAAIEVRRVAH